MSAAAAGDNGAGSLLDLSVDESELIAEQETTPIRPETEIPDGGFCCGRRHPVGRRRSSEMDRTIEETDPEDDEDSDDGRKPLDFSRRVRRMREISGDSISRREVKVSLVPIPMPVEVPRVRRPRGRPPKDPLETSRKRVKKAAPAKAPSGRKRGRPRGSKSSYTVRSGIRKKPVLKAMFGDSTSADRDVEGAKDVAAAAPTVEKEEEPVVVVAAPPKKVTVVRPLFSRHYVVRRPFAIKEENEKSVEFVMHETYFSRLNPYSSSRRNSAGCVEPAALDEEELRMLQLNLDGVDLQLDSIAAAEEEEAVAEKRRPADGAVVVSKEEVETVEHDLEEANATFEAVDLNNNDDDDAGRKRKADDDDDALPRKK